MKLLDLGCADAAIPAWLKRELDGQIDTIDGLDFSVDLVKRAQTRAVEHGLSGSFKVGGALQAPEHFEPGSYDAVVAFELLEHIPNPADLLDVAERMVKPGGKVFLSTPDGTFGDGGNPHHLHALRAVDLAEMLRARGRLGDMAVGSDGVTVASYTPGQRREHVAIYCGPCWMPWSPTDIAEKGLGGSETAAVRLSESLSDLGYVCTVYGDVSQMVYKDVVYRHYSTFDPMEPRGLLISSRIPHIFDQRRHAARVAMLWVHDIDCADALTERAASKVDHILGLSNFHVKHLKGRYPFAKDKIRQARNGIHLPYFDPLPLEQRAQRLIYTSSPDRGLDVLLELWPRIKERCPDAVFSYCYPEVYERVAQVDARVGEFRARVAQLSEQPGTQPLGSLSQPDLARLMCSSRVWAHPSWVTMANQPFNETYAIGAVEAQAAGCCVVASDWGALSETVRCGRRVNSDAPGDRWRDALVEHIVEGLTNDETMAKAIEHAPPAVADLSWGGVAELVHRLAVGEREAVAA